MRLLSVPSVAILCIAALQLSHAQKPSLIPQPAKVELLNGSLHITSGTPLCFDHKSRDETFVANYVASLVTRTRQLTLRRGGQRCPVSAPAVRLKLKPGASTADEGYTLDVNEHGVAIEASTRAGLFYGGVTLWQLLTQTPDATGPADIQFLHIADEPRFAWRGIMLDSARHFQSAAFVEGLIDQMALHKLNTLHWHLTDDQGWRLEIKRYPRLTSVGAWSVPAGPAAAADIDPSTKKPRVYGGFYTQEQVRHLVHYAAERNITIVPELDMPGHSTAAIAAYPQLGSAPVAPDGPSNQWGIHDNILNVDDSTFTFLDNVLTEVMELFPSTYIHVGGDEAQKDQWKASAHIQQQMASLRVSTEDGLQSYFIRRIESFLNAHGRKLIGWDEILQGGIAPNAAVMSWHGVDGGITASKMGHYAVLTPQRPLYFNFRQSDATDEPPGRAPLNTLQDVYNFEPAPSGRVTPEQRRFILGLQANLWTEHVRTEDRVEHMLFPRAAALAEVGWSPEQRDWQSFLTRLVAQYGRYRALRLPAAESPFEVRTATEIMADSRSVELKFSNQVAFGDIHYTLDGSVPSQASLRFDHAFPVALPTTVRAATFFDGRAITSPITDVLNQLSVRRRDSRQMKLCSENPSLQMEDDAPIRGKRAVFVVNYMNPCWIYKEAELDGITQLEAEVGQIPFNLKVGKSKPVLYPPATPSGELQVFVDNCKGTPALTLSLAPAVSNNAITTLRAEWPAIHGKHDLCFNFTRANNDYIWAVRSVQLVPAEK